MRKLRNSAAKWYITITTNLPCLVFYSSQCAKAVFIHCHLPLFSWKNKLLFIHVSLKYQLKISDLENIEKPSHQSGNRWYGEYTQQKT